jgi:hypothetical protein
VTTLSIGNGGVAQVKATAQPMQNVLAVNTLSLATSAKLDLTNNGMIVDYGSSTPIASLTTAVTKAYAGGAWSGSGITSSSAGASGLYTVGLAESRDILGSSGGTWRGRSVDGTAVLLRFTYAGDADLNGAISGDDYGTIDFNLLVKGSSGYFNGDFNFDGVINGDDYGIIDFNILAQRAAL